MADSRVGVHIFPGTPQEIYWPGDLGTYEGTTGRPTLSSIRETIGWVQGRKDQFKGALTAATGASLGAGAAGLSGAEAGATGAGETFGLTGLEGEEAGAGLPLADYPGIAEGAAPSDIPGYDPTLIAEPPVSQGTVNAAGVGTAPSATGGVGNAIARYGPLALGGLGLASNYLTGKRAAAKIAGLGETQRAEGQKLIDQYNSGTLTVADAHNIAAYEASATAMAKQYFAKAGMSDSSSANSALSTIQGNVAAMKDQALQNYLKLGTSMLNVSDEAQLQAIEQGIKNDQFMWQQIFNFGATYGQWNRSLNTMTGR